MDVGNVRVLCRLPGRDDRKGMKVIWSPSIVDQKSRTLDIARLEDLAVYGCWWDVYGPLGARCTEGDVRARERGGGRV